MQYAITAILAASIFFYSDAQLSFTGSPSSPVTVNPAAATGLENIYVLRSAAGVTMSYQSGKSVKWSRFGSNGAAYAEEIATAQSLTLDSGDSGYIVEVDGRQHFFWIVDYSRHQLMLNSIVPAAEQQDCNRTELEIDGNGDRIIYYNINGRSEELSRELQLKYNSLVYDADNNSYRQTVIVQSISSLKPVISVEAPYCNTSFTLSGDRFCEAWGLGQTIESPAFTAYAVTAETSAEQSERDNDNEQTVAGASLGGSAPCEITFSASITDAASFYEWQLAHNPDFDPIDDRYPQTELTYTFRDHGTTYVRFFAADASGQCEYYSPSYEVTVGESNLLCPNAFSPQASPGVNDEWKVSYKSIISFECHIFNRWGTELFSFTDPSVGWDGKYKGKYVPAGTYYYVIKARGSDGRDYKLSGDINIINSKNINRAESSTD